MTVVKLLFTLSLLCLPAMADVYCYYNDFGDVVCRDRLSTAIRIGIGIGSFVVIFAILLVFAAIRRRRLARANMAFVQTSQNQQQGLPNQYPPPPPQGGFPGAPFDANGQKAQQAYNPQQYNGQYDTQYNGQYNPQYNGPQYPPATYEQGTGTPTQPVPPYTGYAPPPGTPPQGHPHNV